MDLLRLAVRVAMTKKTLVFSMPQDQEWDDALWERLGVGEEWERLGRAFYNLGVDVEEAEDIVLEFDEADEAEVRKVIESARSGGYGEDVQRYWTSAQEVRE